MNQKQHQDSHLSDQWSGRLGFILAATGSAVGLGNIWKFPYITGENGGGAFVIVYLVCIALIGLPLMVSEILVGRRGRANPSKSFQRLAEAENASFKWRHVGTFGVLASFLILCFYSVVGGWTLAYLIKAIGSGFADAVAGNSQAAFAELLASPEQMIGLHTVFLLCVAGVVAGGIHKGIERLIIIIMPAMFVLLLLLVGYAATTDAFSQSLAFLFQPDFSKLTIEAVLIALGHAFFTLSLGVAVMIAYGSFLPSKVSIVNASITISILDTLVALLAGIAIFSIVFDNGLAAGSGAGLIFETMPVAFGNLALGRFLGIAFFILLLFAAWSSGISLLEPVVERLEGRHGLSRKIATLSASVVIWLMGTAAALSFNILSDVHLIGDRNIFDSLDWLTTSIMLPLTGLLVAVFCGWVMSARNTRKELGLVEGPFFWGWRILVRFVSPVLVLIVFIEALWPGTVTALL